MGSTSGHFFFQVYVLEEVEVVANLYLGNLGGNIDRKKIRKLISELIGWFFNSLLIFYCLFG